MAQIIEFVFAPPAIAAAIGAYFHLYFPSVSTLTVAIVAYALFTLLNVRGVRLATTFELVVTVLAVVELLIFAGVTLPHFETANLDQKRAAQRLLRGLCRHSVRHLVLFGH